MNVKTRQDRNERDWMVTAACNEGRFPRSRIGHYLAAYDRDPEGTRVLLTADEKEGGLAKGVPASQVMQAMDPGAALTSNDAALLEASRARMRGDLAASRDIMVAASLSVEGVPDIPDMLGLQQPDGFAESSSAPGVVGPSGVAIDAYGTMTFEGLPVSLAEDGSPRVHVSSGAMSIEALKSCGVDLEYERLLAASRARMGA